MPLVANDSWLDEALHPLVAIAVNSHADAENQLGLEVGDEVVVLERDSTGWWGGYKKDGSDDATGWFPGICVQYHSAPFDECATNLEGMEAVVLQSFETHIEATTRPKLQKGDVVFVEQQSKLGFCDVTMDGRHVNYPRMYLAPVSQRVLTIRTAGAESLGVVEVSCSGLAGEICRLVVRIERTLKEFRKDLAEKLLVPTDSFKLITEDGRILDSMDGSLISATAKLLELVEPVPPVSLSHTSLDVASPLTSPTLYDVTINEKWYQLYEAEFPADSDPPYLAVVVSPRTSSDPGQLGLVVGNHVIVHEKTDTGWWGGCNNDDPDRLGWFPACCVKTIQSRCSQFSSIRSPTRARRGGC